MIVFHLVELIDGIRELDLVTKKERVFRVDNKKADIGIIKIKNEKMVENKIIECRENSKVNKTPVSH